MFSRIHEYSGIEDAIERPLWTYSTGMMGRLGFAVAAHVDFDLLLLDEALSAGDISFGIVAPETLTGIPSPRLNLGGGLARNSEHRRAMR